MDLGAELRRAGGRDGGRGRLTPRGRAGSITSSTSGWASTTRSATASAAVQFAEVGVYRDSGSRLAKLRMGYQTRSAYQYKVGSRWRLGGALLRLQSDTYNGGAPFIAPRSASMWACG